MKMSQLPGWAGRAGTWLLDLLFPMKCPFCQHILEDSRAPACPGCQKMLPWLSGREAERPVEFTSGCLSPLAYRDRVPDSIHRYKVPRHPQLCRGLWPAHRPVCPGQPRRPSGSGDLDPPQPPNGGGSGASTRRRPWRGLSPGSWTSPSVGPWKSSGTTIPSPTSTRHRNAGPTYSGYTA